MSPHGRFTNEKCPRAINPDINLESADDWMVAPIRIRSGTSLGANSAIVSGVTVGRSAMFFRERSWLKTSRITRL